MEQNRNTYYRREREYQRRKAEIESKRRNTLKKQAAVLGVVLFLFACF